jgi:hypothetical protein
LPTNPVAPVKNKLIYSRNEIQKKNFSRAFFIQDWVKGGIKYTPRMKKLIQIPRFAELNPHLVMNYVFDELTPGFKEFGFEVRVVYDQRQLEDGGILFFDDFAYKNNRMFLDMIAAFCPNSVCVCWYWFDANYRPFKYMIHTGENNLLPPKREYELHRYLTYMQIPTYTPLVFRPNERIESIGFYPRNVVRDYCYMGAPYKVEWIPSKEKFTGIYHTGDWSVYLSYAQRREIYLSSLFALGFHDPVAVECGSISARIFEGLIYGCVVFCESEFVCNFTDNIVVHIQSKEDLEQKMAFYKANPHLMEEKQQKGYEWMRTKGLTNSYSCSLYLAKIKQLYNLEFD